MLNKTDISNLALGHLGSTPNISDLDADTSTTARIIRIVFRTSLRTLLESYPWGFSTGIGQLALVGEDPIATYGFSYRAPNDALVVRKIGPELYIYDSESREDERYKWKEVYDAGGTLMYSNVEDAWCEYTIDLDPSVNFPTHFGRALSYQLALDVAPSIITGNFAKMKQLLVSDAERERDKGISLDLNRKPRPTPSEPKYLSVRY